MRRTWRLLPVMAGLALSGCATLFNPGEIRTLPEDAGRSGSGKLIRAAPILLLNIPGDASVFRNGRPLDMSTVRSNARVAPQRECRESLDVIGRVSRGGADARTDREVQALRAAFARRFPANCDFTDWPYDVSLMLEQGPAHALRFVSRGREATFTVQTTMHARWIWYDAFLGPAWPVGLLVDARTKKWSYFSGSIDVAKAMTANASR